MNQPTTSEQNAINKSRLIDPDLGRISKVRPGEYQVLGQHDWYVVTVGRDGYHCTCTAGQNDRPACWHRASAYRLRLAQRALKPTSALRAAA
jgi:hypothetical protein